MTQSRLNIAYPWLTDCLSQSTRNQFYRETCVLAGTNYDMAWLQGEFEIYHLLGILSESLCDFVCLATN